MTFNGESISYSTPALLYFIMETTKTDSTKSFTHRTTQWLKTIAKKSMHLLELPLRWVGVRKYTPITLKKEYTPWGKYEQSTDTLAGCERWKNTQSITDWKQEQSLWDTSTAYNKLTQGDIVVLLVFREGASARSVRCVMRRIDWQRVSGVLGGSTDLYRVTTGKYGKPTESEKNSSSATKANEVKHQSVSERGQQQGTVQEGNGRTDFEGVLVFRKPSEKVFYPIKKFADDACGRTKGRKHNVHPKKSKD